MNRARMYSPALGRFLQTDPIGYGDNLNLYAYVGNDPLDKLDPMGLAPGDVYPNEDAAAIAAIGDINPTSQREDTEYAGRIYKTWFGFGSGYSYTAPNRGSQASSNPGICLFGCVAGYHTHGGNDPQYDNENFSPADKDWGDSHGEDLWLGTPTNHIKVYTPKPGTSEQGQTRTVRKGPTDTNSGGSRSSAPGQSGSGRPSSNSSAGPDFAHQNDKPGTSHLCTGSRIGTTDSCS